MKRVHGLWPALTSWENLLSAAEAAARGKHRRPDIAAFDARREEEVARLRDELCSGSYRPGGYRQFVIREAKPRRISAAPFRDRVVHHALCNLLQPIWEKRFIFDSYACRPGKGTHAGADRYQEFSRHAQYVLQCDVSKYFPSIDHEILFDEIRHVVGDRLVLDLVGRILRTHGDAGLLWPAGKGLPLGNQTSQFFSNVYLDRFDHWMKEEMRRRLYVRYCDDFIVLGDSARELSDLREAVRGRLTSSALTLHPRKCRIFPVTEGCDFVGYRIWPTHRLLRRHSGYRFRRRFRGLMRAFARGELGPSTVRQRVASWIGHAQHADTWGLRRDVLEPPAGGAEEKGRTGSPSTPV